MPVKSSNQEQIVSKVERFCAYSERCVQDVKFKLRQLKVSENEQQKIIGKLIENGFINEARYAKAFANDRFKINGWGKIKISFALREKHLPEQMIEAGLKNIQQEAYEQKLYELMKTKMQSLLGIENEFVRKNKVAGFLIGRGFEPDLVWKALEKKRG